MTDPFPQLQTTLYWLTTSLPPSNSPRIKSFHSPAAIHAPNLSTTLNKWSVSSELLVSLMLASTPSPALCPAFFLLMLPRLSNPKSHSYNNLVSVLTISPQRTLMPAVNLIKKVLVSDGRCRSKEQVNGYLLRVLTRCSTIFYMTSRLEANILFLESRRTRLFALPLEKLEELVSRAADMNFNMGSRMFAHAIAVLGCSSIKTLDGKLEVLRVLEFSKDEIESMFNKWPYILGLSETNLRCKLEFFLNNLKITRSMLVQNPILLSFSITERVIPRYKVLEILKSRKLVSKDFSLITAMSPPEPEILRQVYSTLYK